MREEERISEFVQERSPLRHSGIHFVQFHECRYCITCVLCNMNFFTLENNSDFFLLLFLSLLDIKLLFEILLAEGGV